MAAHVPTPTPAAPRVSIPLGQIFSALDPKLIAAIVVLWVLSVVLKPKKRSKASSSRRVERSTARSPAPSRGIAGATRKSKLKPDSFAPLPAAGASISQTPAWITPSQPTTDVPDDLASQVPGATLRSAGAGDELSPWTVGAVGEETTARHLAELGDGWRVVHSIPVGTQGSDLDHLTIGPAGVFVLNSKMRPGADVRVADRGIRVAGVWERYLYTSRHEGERVRAVLAGHGLDVPVRAVIVFVGIKSLAVGRTRPDVAVLSVDDITWWLRGQPVTLSAEQVEKVYEVARRRTTWQR